MFLQEMKKDPYGNCRVLNRHGELMFRCDRRRASWYLVRNLAVIESPEPYTIRLNFETKGPGHVGDEYYLSDKPNCCAVCGCPDHLTRHHIIPRFYRRNFPEGIKARNSFDVLPLCIPCHSDYEKHADDLRKALAVEYAVPLTGVGHKEDPELKRIRQAGLALLFHASKMTRERYECFVCLLRTYLGRQELTGEDFKFCSEIDTTNPHHRDHGAALMERVTDIEAFVRRWREHFLATMRPNFLPRGWHLDRPIFRDSTSQPDNSEYKEVMA